MGKTYFISGATRGIGLQIVTQLATADSSNVVIATARDPTKADSLSELAFKNRNIHIIKLDISSGESIDGIDSQIEHIVKDTGIDVYISNGAIADNTEIAKVQRDLFIKQYLTNTLGPLQISAVLHKYLVKASTRQLVYVSSLAGQLSKNIPFTTGNYGQTKAALNHSIIQLSKELKPEGFTAVAIHPGIVDTDLAKAGFEALPAELQGLADVFKAQAITPEQCASFIIGNILEKISVEDSGKFFDIKDGSKLQF